MPCIPTFNACSPFTSSGGGFIIPAIFLLYLAERRIDIIHPWIASAKASSAIALIFMLFFYLTGRIVQLSFLQEKNNCIYPDLSLIDHVCCKYYWNLYLDKNFL
jgi:hypothetical protein